MKERTSFSAISRSIQRRGNVETGRKERVLSTGYTRKSTVTELIILASTRPQTNPPCDRYSIFATTRWHVYGNIRDVVTRRPNIRPGPWTFQLIIQRVDLNKSTDQSPIFLTLFIRFSAKRARNLSLAPNVFHAIPRPINKTRPSHAPFVRFPCGFRGKKEKTRKREKEKTWRFDLQYFPNWPHFALRFPLRGITDRQIILAASLENFQVYLEEGIVIIGCDNSADGGSVRVRDPRSIFFRGEKSVARSSHGTRVFFNYQRLNGW